jgi:hypothetical protein
MVWEFNNGRAENIIGYKKVLQLIMRCWRNVIFMVMITLF